MKRILVADPSPMMRRNLIMVLQREGYDLLLAENGSAAFQQALEILPELILAEWELCGPGGAPLGRCLKDYPLTAEIPLLVMGAGENERIHQQSLEAGALEYLTKPIDSRHLVGRINHFLQPPLSPGATVTLNPLRTPPRLCQVEAVEGKAVHLGSLDDHPFRLQPGDEVELSYQDERDRSLFHHRAFVHQVEDRLSLSLVGGIYRTQRRQFLRKEIKMPLRYRLEGDFYRIAQAEDVGGGGLRINNVIASAQVGASMQVELRLPGLSRPLAIEGEVIRVKPQDSGSQVALSFRKIRAQDQSALVLFMFGEPLGD
ncbi:MAG: response regulator [Bacteroidota bacterium]